MEIVSEDQLGSLLGPRICGDGSGPALGEGPGEGAGEGEGEGAGDVVEACQIPEVV